MIPWWWLIVVWIGTEIVTLALLALLAINGGPTPEDDAEQIEYLQRHRDHTIPDPYGADW